jgi:hypothetical protein
MKVAKIAIFLTGMIGLAMGGLMSISSLRSQQKEAQIRTYENLKTEAQVLVDQFFGAIEATKNLSQSNVNLSSLPYVSHVGVVKMTQSSPVEFESLATREQMQLGVGKDGKATDTLPDLQLEDRLIKTLKSTLSYSDLQITKFSIGTYEPTEHSNREGIYVATPIYKVINGQLDPTVIDKINLTLLDPSKIMASLTKPLAGGRNAFLINKSGKVLAHSVPAYIGSELKKIEPLREPIENLFLGAQTGLSTHYASVDGQAEQVTFVRAGVYPFAVAAEQPADPAVLSSGWISNQASSGAARQNVGMLMVITAFGIAFFAGASIIVSRRTPAAAIQASRKGREQSNNAGDENDSLPADNHPNGQYAPGFQRWTAALKNRKPEAIAAAAPAPHPASAQARGMTDNRPNTQPPEFTAPAAIARAASTAANARGAAELAAKSFVENRAQLQETQQQSEAQAKRIVITKDYEADFVQRIKSNYTLETIERELAAVSSELTESPVLYFRYARQTQNLNLASVAGEVQIPNYALMQAYIRKDIEQQVERLASEGRVASIANYGPISKLMIANLNTAHFEAWVVNSDAEISGQARMVGVLVILQAGFRSAQTRPVLANILKEAGTYLFAQTSKLRPRRYDDTLVSQGPNA